MTTFTKLAAEIWRAFIIDGDALSGKRKPLKSDIRVWGAELEAAASLNAPTWPQGRLSLTSGVAITESDVVGATADFFVPLAVGNYVPCIVGSLLVMRTFTQLTQATSDATKSPAAVVANKVYGKFLWDDAGTLRCTRGWPWTSDTNPGTGVGTGEIDWTTPLPTNKVAITNGPAAGKGIYVGAVRSDASAQLVDSKAFRWVANLFNAVPRVMQVLEPTNTWAATGSAAVYRQANASALNQLDWLSASGGNMFEAEVAANFSGSAAGIYAGVGIDIDALNTTALVDNISYLMYSVAGAGIIPEYAKRRGYAGIGRHIAIWKEMWQNSGGTGTWYGDAGGTVLQSGIQGWINN